MQYAVLDLEMCKVPKGYRSEKYKWSQETIQIGAVLLNEDYEVVSKFSTYIHPEYGQIDSFIKKLTGINKEDIKNAPVLTEGIQMFMDWLPAGEVRCVSWSTSDEKQLRHEIESKGIDIPRLNCILDEWVDCQKIFDEKLNATKTFSLEEALIASDVCAEGRAHDGLVDAHNTALLFAKLQTNPDFELNKLYQSAHEKETEHLGVTIGELFGNITLPSGNE